MSGDLHFCPQHDFGPIQEGAATVLVGGKPVACVGHRAECDGDLVDEIMTGSATVFIGGVSVSRLGEITAHVGFITEGDYNVLVGGPSTSAVVNTVFGELSIVADDSVGPLGPRQITHSEIMQLIAESKLPNEDWSFTDALKRKILRDPADLRAYKDRWIRDHATAITIAARTQGLPPELLGGAAWIEAGGDPTIQDDIVEGVRAFDHLADPFLERFTVTKKPEYTSFGDVQIQIRRAAEVLDMKPPLSDDDREKIIALLKDDMQNLAIVSRHMRELADIDFKGQALTDDEIRVIGARYNRGSELSLAKIRENTSYGDFILKQRDRVLDLLAEPTVSPNLLLQLFGIFDKVFPGDAMPVARGEL